MNFGEALALALALCVDSLVVSTTTSLQSKISWHRGLLMALVFGLCQGGFPLAGALIGDVARNVVESVDHWVAFGLLAFVGGRMFFEAFKKHEDTNVEKHTQLTIGEFFLLGVATSIDAFAVGIGLGLQYLMSTVLWVVVLVGVVTFLISLVGVTLGRHRIPVPEKIATALAGLVLIGLGTFTLNEPISV